MNGTVAHLPVRFSEAVSASHIAPLEASYDLAPVLTALYIDISDGGPRQHRSGCCPPRPDTLGTENRFLKIRRTCRSVFGGLTSPARRCTLRLNLFTRPILVTMETVLHTALADLITYQLWLHMFCHESCGIAKHRLSSLMKYVFVFDRFTTAPYNLVISMSAQFPHFCASFTHHIHPQVHL